MSGTFAKHESDPEIGIAKFEGTSDGEEQEMYSEYGDCVEQLDETMQLFFCEICLELKPLDTTHLFHCSCRFCCECLKTYATGVIKTKSYPIRCPGLECQYEVHVDEWEDLLPRKSIRKLRILASEAAVPEDRKFYCPAPACSALILVEENSDLTSCPRCASALCLQCKGLSHPGVTCPENMRAQRDSSLWTLAERKRWKSCPSCKHLVQRSFGCSSMRCVCGQKFCYRCGEACPNNHFSEHDCQALTEEERRENVYVGIFMFLILGCALLIPIGIILAVVLCGVYLA